jgi:hypothetical protein
VGVCVWVFLCVLVFKIFVLCFLYRIVYTCKYIYICVCVCVCVFLLLSPVLPPSDNSIAVSNNDNNIRDKVHSGS